MEIGTMQKQTVTIDGVGYDYPRAMASHFSPSSAKKTARTW